MKKKKFFSKLLSLLLVVCILIGLLPMAAFAAETADGWNLTQADVADDESWARFVNYFSSATSGETIKINVIGVVALPAPLKNVHGASLTIQGSPSATGEQPPCFSSKAML